MKLIPDVAEFQTIEQLLIDYSHAAIPGDIAAWKQIFHDNAVMNGFFKDGSKILGPIENLYNRRKDMPFNQVGRLHVDVLDIVGNIAIGRCVLNNFGGKDFVDFHELFRENGQWHIIGKVFQELLDEEPTVEDYAAVRKQLVDYSLAAIPGDIAAWKKIFHEKAVMNGYFKDGSKIMGPIENLYERRKNMPFKDEGKYEVDVLQIVGNIALGRCVLKNYGGKNFVDFHELIRERGEWRIVSKVFQEI